MSWMSRGKKKVKAIKGLRQEENEKKKAEIHECMRARYHMPVSSEIRKAIERIEKTKENERTKFLEKVEALRSRYRQVSMRPDIVGALTATFPATEECWEIWEINALIEGDIVEFPPHAYLERIAHLVWCSFCLSIVNINLPVGLRMAIEEFQQRK